MPTWLFVAINIILGLWSITEIHGLYILGSKPRAYYTMAATLVTYVWVICVVLWCCYLILN